MAFRLDPDEHREALALAFLSLAENLLTKYRFSGVDRADAVQECVAISFLKLHRFQGDRGKAFNFFTTIMLNHCRQLYRTEANYVRLKGRIADRMRADQESDRRKYKG